jgi:hypothetical protein
MLAGKAALNKTGKTRAAPATPVLRADMAVWSMRRLQCPPYEQFTLFHANRYRRWKNGNTDK